MLTAAAFGLAALAASPVVMLVGLETVDLVVRVVALVRGSR